MPDRPLTVELLALPETTPGCIYGLYEVFSAVGVAWAAVTGERTDVAPVEVDIVAHRAQRFVTRAGIPMPARALNLRPEADLVIVPDLDLTGVEDPRGRWPHETRWLRQRYAGGAMLASVCTGSVCIAETGLLDGGEASSHWSAVPLFARHYPAVRLRAERILCFADDARRIITGGGPGTWTDLALHLVARFCGEAEAVRIAKVFVLGDHAEGQRPFAAALLPRAHGDAIVRECQEWVARHYHEDNPVLAMTQRSGLPARTLSRRFRAATGLAPLDYVQTLRIEQARRELETGDQPVDEIAHRVGYEDPAFFRRLFRRKVGTTPSRYRRRFRGLGGCGARRAA